MIIMASMLCIAIQLVIVCIFLTTIVGYLRNIESMVKEIRNETVKEDRIYYD